MKKRIVAVLMMIMLSSSISVFADYSTTQEIELGNNQKIVSVKTSGNSEQYAQISYIVDNKIVWSYLTASFPMAVIDSISNCFVNDGTVYIVEGSGLKAIDIDSGQLEWSVSDQCGTSGILFDEYGNIYNHGFFGPNLLVLNKDGAILYKDDNFDYGRTYDYSINGNTLTFKCEYDMSAGNYEEETVKTLDISQFKPITVLLNGSPVSFDRQPFVQNGRTLVPVRAIFEALGATVDWEPDTQTVSAKEGQTEISLAIGSDKLYVNGEEKIIDVPAQLVGGRTFVPARAVSEALGCDVDWDDMTKTVLITD